jgi:hypothetical protein
MPLNPLAEASGNLSGNGLKESDLALSWRLWGVSPRRDRTLWIKARVTGDSGLIGDGETENRSFNAVARVAGL